MADWTNVSDDALAEGRPVRAVDLRAIRDLTAAGFRGAPNSPTLSPWAKARAPVTAGDITRFHDPVAHFKTDVSNRASGENINLTGNLLPACAVCIMNSGSIRVKWRQGRVQGTAAGGPAGVVGRVRAGVYTLISSELTNTSSGAQEDKACDMTGVAPGDTILWMFRTNSGGNAMQIYDFELATDGEPLHPIGAFFTFGAEPT